MPQVNLTTLNEQELRHRLNASRARGDASLAYEILREMAVRREAPPPRRPWTKRREAEPHLVSVDLDDPLEKSDELPPLPPGWKPSMVEPVAEPTQPAVASVFRPLEPDPIPEAAPEAVSAPPPRASRRKKVAAPPEVAAEDTPEPLVLRAPEPLPSFRLPADDQDWELRLHREEPLDPGPSPAERRGPRPTPRLRIAAGFAIGAISGLALGWGAATMTRNPPPAAAPAQVASLDRQPVSVPAALDVSVAEPSSAPETLPNPAAAPPVEAAEAAPPPEAAEPEPEVPVAEPPAPQPVETVKAAAVTTGCAAEPTPADREICGDPGLQRLQRELRRAYSEALDAHEDRALLRQRQLAWREARNTVSDPDRLARLYERRIQKLHAAAAEARAQR